MVRRLVWLSAALATCAALAGAAIANADSRGGDGTTLPANTKVACGTLAGTGKMMVPPGADKQIAGADNGNHRYTVRVPPGTIPPALTKMVPVRVSGTGKMMVRPGVVRQIAIADKGAHQYTMRVPRGTIPPALTKMAGPNGPATCKVTITAPRDHSPGSS